MNEILAAEVAAAVAAWAFAPTPSSVDDLMAQFAERGWTVVAESSTADEAYARRMWGEDAVFCSDLTHPPAWHSKNYHLRAESSTAAGKCQPGHSSLLACSSPCLEPDCRYYVHHEHAASSTAAGEPDTCPRCGGRSPDAAKFCCIPPVDSTAGTSQWARTPKPPKGALTFYAATTGCGCHIACCALHDAAPVAVSGSTAAGEARGTCPLCRLGNEVLVHGCCWRCGYDVAPVAASSLSSLSPAPAGEPTAGEGE